MIDTCVTFRHRRTLRTSFGVTQALTPSAAFSFSSLLALQREFRKLHSADGSKHSALNSPSSTLTLVLPVISVSASYKLHGRFISIAKDLHGRLKSRSNNDFVQNLHLNRAGATTETRLIAFVIIHSVARVARVCLAFVAVA